MEACRVFLAWAFFAHALLIHRVACGRRVRVSEAISNDISNNKIQNDIPPSIVGKGDLSAIDVPGNPLDPSDFIKGEEMQIVNAPPINGEDAIMAAKLFQGDIVIPNLDVLASLNANSLNSIHGRNAIKNINNVWPNAKVPYSISSRYDANERATIAKAMRTYHDETCIRFVPRNLENDYIYITKGTGCSSAVGRVGGQQTVSLGNGCVYYGIAMHELMHAVGFWHEQSRADRDKYVTIIWNNILPDMEYNFDKYEWNFIQNLSVGYDTGSVMHYGAYSFARDRSKPTIVANYGQKIGQRNFLSSKDVKKLNVLYKCHDTSVVGITTAPPSPVGEICVDSNEFCNYWSSAGECDKNRAWMHNNCPKSCNTCKSECKNDDAHCEQWAQVGYCMKYASYMTKHCKLACDMCNDSGGGNADCKDENEFCLSWAESGECKINPSYMLTSCKKSCKQC